MLTSCKRISEFYIGALPPGSRRNADGFSFQHRTWWAAFNLVGNGIDLAFRTGILQTRR